MDNRQQFRVEIYIYKAALIDEYIVVRTATNFLKTNMNKGIELCLVRSCTFENLKSHTSKWLRAIVGRENPAYCFACTRHHFIHVCRQTTECPQWNNMCVVSGHKIIHHYFNQDHENSKCLKKDYSLEAFSTEIFDALPKLYKANCSYDKLNSVVQQLYDHYIDDSAEKKKNRIIPDQQLHVIIMALNDEILDDPTDIHSLSSRKESKGKIQHIIDYHRSLKRMITLEILDDNPRPSKPLTTDDIRKNGRFWHICQKAYSK